MPRRLKAGLFRAVLLFAIWWILAGGRSGSILFGVVIVAIASAVSVRVLPPGAHRISLPASVFLFAYFLVKSVYAGAQVAWMAMKPRLELRPAMLDITLRLPDEAQRTFLAGMLNLMPGTLSAGLDGDRLILHVLNGRFPVEPEVRSAEEKVARMFGVALP
jgi:multicomponent Na+:H+ antiporter subunit E